MDSEITKSNPNKMCIKYYNTIRPVLRNIVLRGYKSRENFYGINVSAKTYDLILKRLKMYLPKESLDKRIAGIKDVYYFHNHPLEISDNPLAETFRYAAFGQRDCFFYISVLQILSKKSRTKTELCKELAYRGCTLTMPVISQKLREMESFMLIESASFGKNKKQYSVGSNIWDGFEIEELMEIWRYLKFLKNVMPFEIPYYFLEKNLSLYLEVNGLLKGGEMSYQKDIYAFRHRNPINVIDSEVLFAVLKSMQSNKSLPVTIDAMDWEMQEPEKWDETTRRPDYYCKEMVCSANAIRYDCVTGKFYADSNDAPKSLLISDITVKAQYAEGLFHEFHGRYFESIIRMCNLPQAVLTDSEIDEMLFCNVNDYDEEIKEALFTQRDSTDTLFEYEREAKVYRRKVKEPVGVVATQLQREALKSLNDIEYTQLFVAAGTMQKLKEKMASFHSTWSVKDIVISGQEHRREREQYNYENIKRIMDAIERRQILIDCENRILYPLKLEFSLRYNQFRILVYIPKENSYQLMDWGQIDFEQNINEKFIWNSDYMQDLKKRQRLLKIRMNFGLPFWGWDGMLSEDVLRLLATYEKVVIYKQQSCEITSGEFTIHVKVNPEDVDDLLQDLQRYSHCIEILD